MCYNRAVATRTPKSWTPTEYNGQPARLYEDGSIRNERGHMLKGIPGGTEASVAARKQKAAERAQARKAEHELQMQQAAWLRVEQTANGIMVRRPDGKLAKGTRPANAITPETSRELHALRLAKKREQVSAGAAAAVLTHAPDAPGAQTGDYVQAISYYQTVVAMSPELPNSSRAADWVMRHAGLDEPREQQQAGEQAAAVIGALAEFVRVVRAQIRETVEGEVVGGE